MIALFITPLALAAIPISSGQEEKTIAFDTVQIAGEYRVKDFGDEYSQAYFADLKGNLTQEGYSVKELTSITSSSLEGVDALVLGKLRDTSKNFKSSEVSAIANWFEEGGKFLWVGSDSDYVEGYLEDTGVGFKAEQPNGIFEDIGARLRIEFTSVEDPDEDGNAGAPYRVVSSQINTEDFASEINSGVSKVLFHGPTIVVAFEDSEYGEVQDLEDDNLLCLQATSTSGVIVDHDQFAPNAVANGQEGSFCMVAAEIVDTGPGVSKVLAAGESLIGDRGTFNSEYSGVELDGPEFVLNAFEWGTTIIEKPAFDITLIIGIIIVIVIIVAVALYVRR